MHSLYVCVCLNLLAVSHTGNKLVNQSITLATQFYCAVGNIDLMSNQNVVLVYCIFLFSIYIGSQHRVVIFHTYWMKLLVKSELPNWEMMLIFNDKYFFCIKRNHINFLKIFNFQRIFFGIDISTISSDLPGFMFGEHVAINKYSTIHSTYVWMTVLFLFCGLYSHTHTHYYYYYYSYIIN